MLAPPLNACTWIDSLVYFLVCACNVQVGVIMGTPTRVVCLRNMVGPGEVDPDLEDEVANECSKYGQVQSVMIFEVTTPGYPDDQAVRIFVEFERMEQATKVMVTALLQVL